MSARSSAQKYRGLDAHLHVTVHIDQMARLKAHAKRTGVSLSVVVRGMIDQAKLAGEVKK